MKFIQKIIFVSLVSLQCMQSWCASNSQQADTKQNAAVEQRSVGGRLWDSFRYVNNGIATAYSCVKIATFCAKTGPTVVAAVKTGVAVAAASPVTVPALVTTGTTYGLYKGYRYVYPTVEEQAKRVSLEFEEMQRSTGLKKIEVGKGFRQCLVQNKGLPRGSAEVPDACWQMAFDYANLFGDRDFDQVIASFNDSAGFK